MAEVEVTMKSLLVIAVAGAIFAICSVGVEGKSKSEPRGVIEGTKPMKNFCSGVLVI